MIPLDTGADLLRYLLGAGGGVVIIGALVQAALKLYENRTTYRDAKIAVSSAEELEDGRWNAAYRAGAEVHILTYDVPMQRDLLEARAEVNRLERELGKEPRAFPPLPDVPPLFPRATRD